MTADKSAVTTVSAASARHDGMVAAYDSQRARTTGPRPDAWAGCAQSFKADPRRELDGVLAKIASYLRADDTLIDVGGGGGRMSLPLALRCRQVINIDPSPAMHEVFGNTASEARIANARFVQSGWLEAEGIEGDMALVAHVTYFVPKIVPFIEKLNSATRRRVIVAMRTVPPPNQVAPLFRFVHNEELAPVPGPKELLAVLEEMGIRAETIDIGPAAAPSTAPVARTRAEATRIEIEAATRAGWLTEHEADRLRRFIDDQFDELFVSTDEGFRRRIAAAARDLLITWEPR
jgi:SAM-dependent methyltransferase